MATNIEEAVQAVLVADAGVTALVTADKIRTPGNWQDLTGQYIIHKPVTVETTRMHSGMANLKIWHHYQVDCFGPDYASAKAVAVAVRAALGSYRASNINSAWIGEGPHLYQQNINVHQIPVEFEIADCL